MISIPSLAGAPSSVAMPISASRARAKAGASNAGGATPTPTPALNLLSSGISQIYGAQNSNTAVSRVNNGQSGVGVSWVNKYQIPAGAIGYRIHAYNAVAVQTTMRNLKVSVAMTERGAVDTLDNAYSAWSGGTKHNTAAPADPLGFRPATWNGGALTASPVLPRPNSPLPSSGYNNQRTYVSSDIMTGLVPVRATDRIKEEYYAIVRAEWDLLANDGISRTTAGASVQARDISIASDRADYPLTYFGRADPADSVATPSAIPANANDAYAEGPCIAIEWFYPPSLKAITMWMAGDSLTESYQWLLAAAWQLSTPARPIHMLNLGGSTTKTESYVGNLYAALQKLTRPDFVVIPSNSINNKAGLPTYLMSQAVANWASLKPALDMLIAEDIKVIVWTCFNFGAETDDTDPGTWINNQARAYVAANPGKAFLMELNKDPAFNRTNYNASTNPAGWVDEADSTHPARQVIISRWAELAKRNYQSVFSQLGL